MRIIQATVAYLLAAAATHAAAAGFYTQQIIARQAEIGAVYTTEQAFATYLENLVGLAPAYGVVLSIALLVGFVVAFGVKRVLKPLAPVAYPAAGFASVIAAILLIENTAGAGGVGAIGGARGAAGLLLQGAAGALGGLVFSLLRPR